jgi:serine protease AprX
MKLVSLIIILCFTLSMNAQNKYFIYFKDKGIAKGESLQKSSPKFIEAEQLLSKRSIERRKKSMGEDNYITYEDLPVSKNYITDVENLGIKIIRKLKWFNAVTANLNDDQLQLLNSFSFIKKIEPVRVLKYKHLEEVEESIPAINKINKTGSTTYSYGSSLGQAEFSNVPDVHNLGITGANVRIGIMDSGFEWQNHPALSGALVIAEYDFVNNDGVTSNQEGDVSNQHNHGTNVMSVIAGFSPDTLIGLAFDSEFVLAKTEDIPTETHVEEDNYAAALEWFDSLGVDVTNSSVGYNEFDSGQFSYTYSDMNGSTAIVTQAENLAFTRGIVTVTSAGNEGNNSWYYINAPADAFNTISVGAALPSRNLTSYSSHGPTFDGRIKPEVVNQGSSVFVANPFSGYRLQNGTSFSSPLTAGIVSLLLSAHPHLKNTQVRRIILESGDRSENPDNDYGWGLISASKAIGFPNISKVNDQFTLHKIFVTSNGVASNTAKINYKINGGDFQEDNLVEIGLQKFNYPLNGFSSGDSIHFYFTYNDSSGNFIREPESKNYKLIYGDLNVLLSVDDVPFIPEDYTLEQNYPNPFNPTTTIEFFPVRNEFAELKVFDILGRQVKTLFKGIAEVGGETVKWDGTNNSGLRVNSGIYFYSLNIGGTQLTKKMVYIK